MVGSNEDFVLLDRDDVSDYNEANILPEPPESQENITAWLRPTAYDAEGSEYRKHLASHLAGTGRWLTATEVYKQWHDSPEHGLLWIKGIPGCGKSVFAANLAKQVAEEACPVLFFFFRQIIDANHEPVSLLRDWLCQILRFSPPLQAKISAYIKAGRNLETLSMDELWKDLRLALSHQSQVYVIADALDEIDGGNDTFLIALAQLGRWRPAKVKVLITSRPVSTVENPLRKNPSLQIRLEEHLVDFDIATYVHHRLRGTTILESDRRTICQAVPGRASGLFLYARLAMDAFLEPDANIQEVLQDLPADLNVMYADLLREHARRSGVPHDIQLHMMQFVTHASRPLRLLELAEMINVTFNDRTQQDLKGAKALIRAACGPLIEILPDETVSVVHHSLTEFLKGSTRMVPTDAKDGRYPILHTGPTHSRLALSCLKYLQSGCLSSGKAIPTRNPSNRQNIEHTQLKLEAPFVAYASENWHVHVFKAALGLTPTHSMTEIHAELDKLLQPGQQRDVLLDMGCAALKGVQHVTGLHVGAWSGLSEYAALLLDRSMAAIDAVDGKGNTPLHYAANEGHSNVVQLLLSYGAQPDVDNEIGLKPLHEAASNNRAAVVKLLLEAGVDPLTPKTKESGQIRCGNAPRTFGHTALMYACHNGHAEVVAEFLPYLEPEIVHKALSWAASKGQSKAVKRILLHPEVDPNALYRGDSALFCACIARDRDTIRILLENGADPNQRCENASNEFGGGRIAFGGFGSEFYQRGHTPMHAFAGLDRRRYEDVDPIVLEEVFNLLVRRGGDINEVDRVGKTPLHYACKQDPYSSHEDKGVGLVQLFLDAGADANVPSNGGETPLHLAMNDSSGKIMRVLIEQGKAGINNKASDGRTPLFYVLDSHNAECALRLLQYRPDCTLTDTEGNGPLHVVLKSFLRPFKQDGPSNIDLIKALLAAGADPTLKNHQGQTALHVYHYDNLDLFPALLEGGADLEARDNEGRTVLQLLVGGPNSQGRTKLQDILKLGARTDCRDYRGRTLLNDAVKCGDMDTLRLLLNSGVPLENDYAANNALHELAKASVSVSLFDPKEMPLLSRIQELIDLGVDPNQSNCVGCTPLHVVSFLSRSNIVSDLQPIDPFLQVCPNVNAVNNHGITPLHFASAVSEYTVGRLLEAGATVPAATFDGLSPLHIAAQLRQSNIVGMLLEHQENAAQKTSLVRMQDKQGNTALHYACRSGRYETVSLLLDAGADSNTRNKYGIPPWGFCAEFEQDQELWKRQEPGQHVIERAFPDGLGIVCQERPRNNGGRNYPHHSAPFSTVSEDDTTHLEEIIDLLLSYGADPTVKIAWGQSILSHAVCENVNRGHDYTAKCFMALKHRVSDDDLDSKTCDFPEVFSKYRTEAAERALKDSLALKPGIGNEDALKQLLSMRHFHLVEEMARAGVDFLHPNHSGETHLHLLAKWGYSQPLAAVGSHEAELMLEDRAFCEQWETHRDGLGSCQKGSIKPLLITACERELPNMEVVKVLVEKHKVDINVQHCEEVWTESGAEVEFGMCALHAVSSGRHWWQVAQALPYLLEAGADTEIKDEAGLTPLHVALDASNYRTGFFHKCAAKALLEHGADANVVDHSSRSCLATARGDNDLIKLLLQYGARVTASAIFAAIDSGSCDSLRVLLSRGADPNQRMSKSASREPSNLGELQRMQMMLFRDAIDEDEWYPIHYAAVRTKSRGSPGITHASTKDHRLVSAELVRVLLEHAADPYQTFRRRVKWINADQAEEEFEECRVLHFIIESSGVIEPFLEMESLKPDCRDAKGKTLFLAACSSIDVAGRIQGNADSKVLSIATKLLERGADICAKDLKGWNALHHALNPETYYQEPREKIIDLILSRAPQLINEQNSTGDTPFHHALTTGSCSLIEQLLEAGADPRLPDSNGNNSLFHLTSKMASRNEAAFKLFKRFLGLGLSISSRNKLGETPLFALIKACPCDSRHIFPAGPQNEQSYKSLIQLYVDAGASVFERDGTGQTLLHLVASKQDNDSRTTGAEIAELFAYLMELGLDPMTEDERQRTSLDAAATFGNEKVLKLFERNGSQRDVSGK